MMTQDDIDNRRRYIKSLLDQGRKLDYKALANKFNCSATSIYTDKKIVTEAGNAGFSFIYALSDETGIRYIGQATNPSYRLTGHIVKSRNGEQTDKGKWIRSLLEQDKTPTLGIIEKCPRREADGREWYWIRYYKEQGYSLVNM